MNFFIIDSQISNFITRIIPHNFITDQFFEFLSLKGFSILIWIIILVIYMVIEERKDKRIIVLFFVSFIVSILLISNTLKLAFSRQRPIPNKLYSVIACPTDYSFPSGHATGAFSAAVIFAYFDKKRRWFYYSVASLIGLSRIYLQCHYLSDVVAGALLGSATSYIILKLSIKKDKTLEM